MGFFTGIQIQGFRRIGDVSVELRPLMVLVGANGIGKSSFLDVWGLLSRSARGELEKAMSDMGGLGSVLTLDGRINLILLVRGQDAAGKRQSYLLTTGQHAHYYRISGELLKVDGKQLMGVDGDRVLFDDGRAAAFKSARALETLLSQWHDLPAEAQEFRERLKSVGHYRPFSVEARSPIRLPQPLQPADTPGERGEDLVSCLYNMRESHRDRFEAVEDTLRAAFRGFEQLGFPPVAAGTLAVTWKEERFSRPLYMHQLSDGTLRFLWLVTLLQSPGLPQVTLIDEPEMSLHPELLNLLAETFREASSRTQLIVATHSDRLIRFLKPDEVAVMDAEEEDGLTRIRWASEMDLEKWLADYALDDLWRMGVLGGRA